VGIVVLGKCDASFGVEGSMQWPSRMRICTKSKKNRKKKKKKVAMISFANHGEQERTWLKPWLRVLPRTLDTRAQPSLKPASSR